MHRWFTRGAFVGAVLLTSIALPSPPAFAYWHSGLNTVYSYYPPNNSQSASVSACYVFSANGNFFNTAYAKISLQSFTYCRGESVQALYAVNGGNYATSVVYGQASHAAGQWTQAAATGSVYAANFSLTTIDWPYTITWGTTPF